MCEENQHHTRCRTSQTLVGCLAFLVLLSPLSVQLANGQVSVTITILINAVVDEPLTATTEPTDPPPAEAAAAEQTPNAAAEQTSVDEPVGTQPESSSTESPQELPAASGTTTQETRESGDASAPLAEVVEISAESSISESSGPAAPQQPTPPLEQPLSVGPVRPLIPEDRPNWIMLEPDYSADIHRFVVSSIPTTRESDVDANLDAPLEEALRSYVAEQFTDDRAGEMLTGRLSAAFIRTNLVDDQLSYTAELSTTSGGMFQKWVMVEVSGEQREQLQTWYREQVQRERILPLGLGVAGLLSVVGLLNVVFRKAAGKTPVQAAAQPLQLAVVEPEATKKACCSKKGRLGLAVAIAIAIAAAIFAG
jgi:hypothetical protein